MLATAKMTPFHQAPNDRPAGTPCAASEAFIASVARRSGCSNGAHLRATVLNSLRLLAARLRPVDARAVAAKLPAWLGATFERPLAETPVADELIAMQLSAIPAPQLRAVCQLLAEQLDAQARTQLRIQPLSRLFRSAA